MCRITQFSTQPCVQVFRDRPLPMSARLAGYSALMNHFDLGIPLHHEMAAISQKNARVREKGWVIHPITRRPPDRIVDHLVFALKYEGVQLLTLKKIFNAFDKRELEGAALEKPTSAYLRRLCFLYEWLTANSLDLPDIADGAYVDAVDGKRQYGTEASINEKRFRIRNNLPGIPDFCPLVFKTNRLKNYIESGLSEKARQIVLSASKELISRAAAFLLLSDSKASFAIEGENPSRDRIARWGRVLGKAGQIKLDLSELERLQRDLIGDDRFVVPGLRTEGGFVGRHDSWGQPEPDHISASAADLPRLIAGLQQFDRKAADLDYHPVLAAASIAFGFVYAHPFEDGNGRIHRFLMHHVLSERKFTPEKIIFPISSVILDDIAKYKDVLESVSRPLLDWIAWAPTSRGNVQVVNDTADFYRYFDATTHAEYLFNCIARCIEKDLPEELAFLEIRDEFHRRVTNIVDMPQRTIDLLLRFLRQGQGTLSKRARTSEFEKLTFDEVAAVQAIYTDVFRRADSPTPDGVLQ